MFELEIEKRKTQINRKPTRTQTSPSPSPHSPLFPSLPGPAREQPNPLSPSAQCPHLSSARTPVPRWPAPTHSAWLHPPPSWKPNPLAHSPFPQPSPNSSRPSLLLSLFCARADPAFPTAHLPPPPASRPSDPVASRSAQCRGLPCLPLPYHTAHAAAQLTASPPYAPLQPRSPIPAWPLPTATQHASLLPSWARKSATATARSRFPPHPSPAPRASLFPADKPTP